MSAPSQRRHRRGSNSECPIRSISYRLTTWISDVLPARPVVQAALSSPPDIATSSDESSSSPAEADLTGKVLRVPPTVWRMQRRREEAEGEKRNYRGLCGRIADRRDRLRAGYGREEQGQG